MRMTVLTGGRQVLREVVGGEKDILAPLRNLDF